jgi:hypothetical protein
LRPLETLSSMASSTRFILVMMATSVALLSPSAFADREEATVWTAAKKPDFGFDLTHASSAAPGDEPSGGGGKTLDPAWEAPEWLGGKPNMGTWLAEGIVVGGWVALWIDDDVGTTEETGEYTQLIPPATALGMALGTKDWKGTKQLIWSGLLSGGTVHLLKNVIEKNRPDASNTQSYERFFLGRQLHSAALRAQVGNPRNDHRGLHRLEPGSSTESLRRRRHLGDEHRPVLELAARRARRS